MKKENNKKIGLAVLGILVLVGVFYGGFVYGKSRVPTRGQGQTFGMGNFTGGIRNGRMGMGNFTTGEIIAKDDKSITVKLADDGSKIIFLDNSTKISKQVAGTLADLTTGTQVSVSGTANADGSLSAQSVQIRPNLPPAVVK